MELTKRSIPRIASAGLLLGGGCSSSSSATPGDVAFHFCDAVDYCLDVVTPAGYTVYYEDYTSTAQCRSIVGSAYADYAAYYDGISRACGDAFLDYYECFFAEYSRAGCSGGTAASRCAGLSRDFDFFCF